MYTPNIHQSATSPYRGIVPEFASASKSSSDDDDDEFLPSTGPCPGFDTEKGWNAVPLTPEAKKYYERIVQSCRLRLRTTPNYIDYRSQSGHF